MDLRRCRMVRLLALACTSTLFAQINVRNPKAVEEVVSGRRETANAAWWGFDAEDSTQALQSAIDSGARRVVVPYMGNPWIITPVKLRGNQELLFEPGVVLLAKKGAFLGRGESLLTADGVENLTIRGYGAVLRMHKPDYQRPPYPKAEWRMGLALRGVKNVLVEGLRSESSGGDGFYISGNSARRWSEDVTVRDCVAEDNHRQGMSVISAVNLRVENCRFSSTGGTAPEAGIDLEPDHEQERLQNIVVRNSIFENNRGHAILVYLRPLTRASAPVSIRFENCISRMSPGAEGGHAGIAAGAAREDGPRGLIEFVNCVAESTGRESVKIYDKAASGVKVRFTNCHWKSPWQARAPEYGGPRVPVLLQLRRPELAGTPGGVEFENCYVYDTADRPVIQFEAEEPSGLTDVRGGIVAVYAKDPRARLGGGLNRVDVKVIPLAAPSP